MKKIVRTDPFKDDFKRLPEDIKQRVEKALKLLVSEFHYPSLHTKKIKGVYDPIGRDLWEARVSKSYRLIFTVTEEAYILYRVGPHDILRHLKG